MGSAGALAGMTEDAICTGRVGLLAGPGAGILDRKMEGIHEKLNSPPTRFLPGCTGIQHGLVAKQTTTVPNAIPGQLGGRLGAFLRMAESAIPRAGRLNLLTDGGAGLSFAVSQLLHEENHEFPT